MLSFGWVIYSIRLSFTPQCWISHFKKQCNTNRSQNQYECRETTREKHMSIHFLWKPTFEMLLFPSHFVKKCVHNRLNLYVVTSHKCRILDFSDPDLHKLPSNIKRQHPSTPQKHRKLPSRNSNLKTIPNIEPKRRSHL